MQGLNFVRSQSSLLVIPRILLTDRLWLQHHDAETDLCPFATFDARATEVNEACCNQNLATTARQVRSQAIKKL